MKEKIIATSKSGAVVVTEEEGFTILAYDYTKTTVMFAAGQKPEEAIQFAVQQTTGEGYRQIYFNIPHDLIDTFIHQLQKLK